MPIEPYVAWEAQFGLDCSNLYLLNFFLRLFKAIVQYILNEDKLTLYLRCRLSILGLIFEISSLLYPHMQAVFSLYSSSRVFGLNLTESNVFIISHWFGIFVNSERHCET